jgi:hypothetical protein
METDAHSRALLNIFLGSPVKKPYPEALHTKSLEREREKLHS